MQSNFVFLQNDFPVLYQIGIIAEKYLYTDSNVFHKISVLEN